MTLAPTKLLYLNDSYKFEDKAKVLVVQDGENDKKVVLLDQTIFYPQGGGQAYDTGRIENSHGTFHVQEVRFIDGIVHHIGTFESGSFETSQDVKLHVDKERRMLNTKLQSGGHLLDIALRNIGHNLTPSKGYHFPDGPYVEYDGDIPIEKREEIRAQLEKEVNRLIKEGFEVKTQLVDKEKLKELCYFVPEFIPKDKPARVVVIYGKLGLPCGGTHVKNIKDIGKMTITKISTKSGKTRISYFIE